MEGHPVNARLVGKDRGGSRREFLTQAALAGAAMASAPLARALGSAPRRAYGPTDDVRLAVVGLHGKGWGAVGQAVGLKGAKVVALCDVDQEVLDGRVQDLDKKGIKVAAYRDFRRLLETDGVDAVILATPNHHHTLQTIWACQAGKDVYVEKPVSHSLFESRQITAAASKYRRVVQAGTQNRSDEGLIPAFAAIRQGELGKIKLVRGFCYKLRRSIGRTEGPQPVPASVDYDLWCGPAPKDPLRRAKLHYDWHWFWATGNGDIGNQGPHELDLARWVLGEPDLPRRVLSIGGRLGYVDDAETANTQLALFDYPTAPLLFEVRGLPLRADVPEAEPNYRGIRVGVVVECEKGYFAGGRGGGWFYDRDDKKVRHFPGEGGESHLGNFLDAVRAGSPRGLRAPVREGAVSSSLAHMANLAHRTGHACRPEEIRERLQGNQPATEAVELMFEHLKANHVDLSGTPLTLGGWLEWDDRAGRFHGGAGFEEANKLIARNYRAPFVVPEKI